MSCVRVCALILLLPRNTHKHANKSAPSSERRTFKNCIFPAERIPKTCSSLCASASLCQSAIRNALTRTDGIIVRFFEVSQAHPSSPGHAVCATYNEPESIRARFLGGSRVHVGRACASLALNVVCCRVRANTNWLSR